MQSTEGEKAVFDEVKKAIPVWPLIYQETTQKLKTIYVSGKWSFNGSYEQKFSSALLNIAVLNTEYSWLMVRLRLKAHFRRWV